MVMFYPLTGFGSALNIETLVAAAEKRETPIEVTHSLCYLLKVFMNSSSLDECGCIRRFLFVTSLIQ